jgi:mRNA interferase HicA
MNGKEFIRRARRWAKAYGVELVVDASRGKGGHQQVRGPGGLTHVKTGEIGPGLLQIMLKQLGIPKDEF